MTEPHASWADIYDLVYEESFGKFYDALTNATIDQIKKTVQPPASIVDFGAGTGRLSIPLAAHGYIVTAVEPCQEMYDQLRNKPGGEAISGFIGKMEDFETDTRFDMAICVFTVLLYLPDETSLRASLAAAYKSLRSGGYLLIDVPLRGIFNSFRSTTSLIQREVTVTRESDDIYLYEERSTLNRDGRETCYTDQFNIRYWNPERVLRVLTESGFSLKEDISEEFAGSCSEYFLMQK
jgi:SAM-dependent methyltransferase